MYCSNCNNDVPDSSIMCPICGEPLAKKAPMSSSFGISPASGSSYYNDTPISPSYVDLSPVKKKSATNPLVLIIIILAVAALCVFGYFKFFGNKKYNGTYYLKEISVDGITLSAETFQAYGYDLTTMCLEIDGDKATLSGCEALGYPGRMTLPITIKNGKIDFNHGELTGTCKDGEVTITMDEGSITFAK